MFEFFSPKKKALVAVLVLAALAGALTFGIFDFVKPAEAAGAGTVAKAIGWVGLGSLALWGGLTVKESISNAIASFDTIMVGLLAGLAKFLGKVFIWVVDFLVKVAGYNDFLNATAVVTGWVIVRDVANMFFVLILLVISIATILRVEAYSYKKLLPKLLLMAVLINFSKTICGIIIDFAQVIMLTFVNAFQAAAGANFFQALGINKLFSFDNLATGTSATGQQWDLVGTALLAMIVVLIATITVGVLMVVLVVRIVVLWTLIVLSPLAYLLASFPQGQSYAKQWWDEFSKYVISGPILAFFIWLALIVAGGGNANMEVGADFTGAAIPSSMGDIADPNLLSSLVVGIVLLLVGLMFTQKLGIVGSEAAGMALSGLRRAGTAPFRTAWRGAKGGVGLAWKGVKGTAKFGAGQVSELTYAKTGVALPFSERRKEARAKRRKNISTMREAEGMARSAERSAGGRALLASILDPRAATKVSRWEMAKATFGDETAQNKVRRAADSLATSAADEMRPVDKLQGERLKQRTEEEMSERRVAKIKKDPEFQSVMNTREADLIAAETRQQNDVQTRQAEADTLAQAAKFHKLLDPTTTTDDDIRDAVSEEGAKTDLNTEKERRKRLGLSDMSKNQEQAFFNRARGNRRGAVDPAAERANMNVALGAMGLAGAVPPDDMVRSAQTELAKAKEKLDAATHSLQTYRDRDRNPKAAREDALSRREAARERGDDAEVRKINFELGELEPVIKIKDVQNFFKMSYEEQVKVAVKSAEGLSESKLAKDIAASLKSGEISTAERNEVMKLWAEKDFHTAKERLEDILKKVRAAKQTP